MKRFVVIILVFIFLSLSLIGCGCRHDNLSFVEDTATCEFDGVKRYKCDDCGEIIEQFSQKQEHDFSVFVEDTATCESNGNIIYKCSNCSTTKSETSEKKGHSFKGCVCERCNMIKTGYNKVTISYTSDKFHYSDYFSSLSGSNYVLFYIDINNSTSNIDYYYSGQIYYYGSIKLLNCYITIYDLEGNLIVDKTLGYIPNSGKFFSSKGKIESSRILENGEECYIYLNAKTITL